MIAARGAGGPPSQVASTVPGKVRSPCSEYMVGVGEPVLAPLFWPFGHTISALSLDKKATAPARRRAPASPTHDAYGLVNPESPLCALGVGSRRSSCRHVPGVSSRIGPSAADRAPWLDSTVRTGNFGSAKADSAGMGAVIGRCSRSTMRRFQVKSANF